MPDPDAPDTPDTPEAGGPDLATGDQRVVSVDRLIAAAPEAIFDLLADPAAHGRFDGSGTVMAARGNPDRLTLGARFGMDMRMGLPYRVTNEVVELEENRLIAWRHLGRHVWRYRLEPVEGGTLVTESFDWSTAWFPPFYEWVGYPPRHKINMARTLDRLAELVEQDGQDGQDGQNGQDEQPD